MFHPCFVLGLFDTGLAALRALGRAGLPALGFDYEPEGFGFQSRYGSRVVCPHPDAPAELIRILCEQARPFPKRPILYPTSDAFVAFVSENLHRTLHKISELYDRIAFAAVGRYNEYENLRIAGVRLADMRGYSYDRRDVTGRGLANAYAQTLGTIFSSGAEKPYEVEIFVAEVGDARAEDQIYRLTYQGSVADEHRFAVMGGSTERVEAYLNDHYREDLDLDAAVHLGVTALGHDTEATRTIPANEVEAAVLERSRGQQRKFRRLSVSDVQRALDSAQPEAPASEKAEPATSEAESGGIEGGGIEGGDAVSGPSDSRNGEGDATSE